MAAHRRSSAGSCRRSCWDCDASNRRLGKFSRNLCPVHAFAPLVYCGVGVGAAMDLEADQSFLAGGGEMGERTRAMDWSSSPVGPVAGWPQSLKTAVSICLGSRHPMV